MLNKEAITLGTVFDVQQARHQRGTGARQEETSDDEISIVVHVRSE
jgi:hypothetical protein